MRIGGKIYSWLALGAFVLALSAGCGGGCGGCTTFEPIPGGGFPAAKRTPNAGQLRVTSSGLAAIAADPAAVLGSVGGAQNGVLKFDAPASCGGQTPICCPNGQPVTPCGPIDIDLNQQAGDAPRLELKPASGASRLDVTVRARVKTEQDIPVKLPLIGNCGVKIDTTAGSIKDIQIDAPINFQQDGTAGTTRIAVGTVAVNNLASEDVSLNGGFGCTISNALLGLFIGILKDQITGAIQSAIQDQTCAQCPGGTVEECGSFATGCSNKVCQEGSQCLQKLGLEGRARAGALFGAFSPGTTGAIDVYEVAGGYATSNNNGLALGLLGGMQPGGTVRDRCGPMGTPPAAVSIPQSAFFQGNTRPDNGQAFGLGIGIHKSQLAEFAYAGYDGGFLCLTVGGNTITQLSTDTFSIISRSLGTLVEGNSPMAVGLRPQSQPTITLGRNIFVDDGMGGKTLQEALMDIKFTAMEIDFFASIDDQFVRVFTVVSDVHLPVGLQVTGAGQIQPVLGNPDDAFTNISVKNSEAITESPADLAAAFPALLSIALPQLSGGLGAISLPDLGGLKLDVTDITAVDNVSFLAIFANLAAAKPARPVETLVSLGETHEPPASVIAHPQQWAGARLPSVSLDLGGEGLEYSWQIDEGTWSAWSKNLHPTIASRVFFLPGTHHLQVRARQIGRPETMDLTPVGFDVTFGAGALAQRKGVFKNPFHGQPGEGGCTCESSNNAGAALPFGLVLLMLLLPMRRILRRAAKLGAVVWLTALFALPGCECGGPPCGDQACLPGDLERGGVGRFTSIAADGSRVLVATYEQKFGDLLVVDATDPANQVFTAVDGIPDTTPTHDPASYRGGVEDPGDDVGVYTSIGVVNGLGMVAYQDRTNSALKFAIEQKQGKWSSYVVDAPDPGEEIGRYASLAFDANGHPAIAYIALGIDDGSGHRVTELRVARAGSQNPGESEWSSHTVATAVGTCAGLCGAGEACVAGTGGQTCIAPTADCTTACAADEACNSGTCTPAFAEPEVATLASGTGLFASLVGLPDGRLAVAYYDQTRRALILSAESAADANDYAETVLHQTPAADVGMWASAAADGAGTVHVAYQDATGDQTFYTTWNGTAGTPELVDDGQRAGDRTHSVGAATAIYFVNNTPTIAYQDGLTADVYVASRGGGTWTTTPFAMGPLLDGFSIGATTGGGVPILAWGRLDPAASPVNQLAIENP
jgi:hypothetical protein